MPPLTSSPPPLVLAANLGRTPQSLIAGIAKKTAEFKLVGTYVTSPLNWAVIVGKESKYQSLADLRGEKIGISRIGRCACRSRTLSEA